MRENSNTCDISVSWDMEGKEDGCNNRRTWRGVRERVGRTERFDPVRQLGDEEGESERSQKTGRCLTFVCGNFSEPSGGRGCRGRTWENACVSVFLQVWGRTLQNPQVQHSGPDSSRHTDRGSGPTNMHSISALHSCACTVRKRADLGKPHFLPQPS